MSKNKELAEYIMDQLSDLGDIRNIPMMGRDISGIARKKSPVNKSEFGFDR